MAASRHAAWIVVDVNECRSRCLDQSAQKFKARYATLGFSDKAKMDQGNMWPTSFALSELTPAEEATIAALVKKVVS